MTRTAHFARTPSLAAAVLAAAFLAGGCAATARVPSEPPALWRDSEFGDAARQPVVSRAELFQLPDTLRAELSQRLAQHPSRREKLALLLHTVYGPAGVKGFQWRSDRSTVAAETWRESRGDCLSLTVLAYAVAVALEMPAQMQEVDGPWLFDRHGELDFVNLHVNLVLAHARQEDGDRVARDIAIDFDPDMASRRRGLALDEPDMLARYYNNVGVQALSAGDHRRAYGYFRAAARTRPAYATPFANLAVLYRAQGLDDAAEASLRHALALDPGSVVALHGLHALLLAQGRDAEAQQVGRSLEARRSRDPYYWIGRGRLALERGDARTAVDELEQAQAITAGFDELHRDLAIAYARAGQPGKADAEIRKLAGLGVDRAEVAMLRRKIELFSR